MKFDIYRGGRLLAYIFFCCVLATPGALSARNVSALLGWEQSDGHRELLLLQQSYPQAIKEVRFIDNDWAARIGDRWFFWSHARLLSVEERANWTQYQSIRFYNYYRGPVRRRALTAEQIASLQERLLKRPARTIKRYNGFLNALYGINTQQEGERNIQTVQFLGHTTRVHPYLIQPLRRVERNIARAARSDSEVATFVREMHAVSGYVWRNISGTESRSYHSYGIAVDLLFASYRGLHVYWRWSMEQGIEDWWDIPIENRWAPPQKIIDIFEDAGFVWGGKWVLFDTLHFEYRPEILRLAHSEKL